MPPSQAQNAECNVESAPGALKIHLVLLATSTIGRRLASTPDGLLSVALPNPVPALEVVSEPQPRIRIERPRVTSPGGSKLKE